MKLKSKTRPAATDKINSENPAPPDADVMDHVDEKLFEGDPREDSASTQIVQASNSEMTVVPSPPSKPSAFVTDPDIISIVANAQYGQFPQVVATNGTHMANDGTEKFDLGKKIKFQTILVNNKWVLSLGSNSPDAKEYFAVSYDGSTVYDGRSMDEAMNDAHDAGFTKAEWKDYLDIACILTECEENEDMVGETVMLQLSPTSVWQWNKLEKVIQMRVKAKKAEVKPVFDDPDNGYAVVLTSTATAASYQGNNFTKLVFSV